MRWSCSRSFEHFEVSLSHWPHKLCTWFVPPLCGIRLLIEDRPIQLTVVSRLTCTWFDQSCNADTQVLFKFFRRWESTSQWPSDCLSWGKSLGIRKSWRHVADRAFPKGLMRWFLHLVVISKIQSKWYWPFRYTRRHRWGSCRRVEWRIFLVHMRRFKRQREGCWRLRFGRLWLRKNRWGSWDRCCTFGLPWWRRLSWVSLNTKYFWLSLFHTATPSHSRQPVHSYSSTHFQNSNPQ